MLNRSLGILLEQSGAIDRIVFQSVPRVNLNARGEAVPPIVGGDRVVEEYLDLDDEGYPF